MSLVVADAWAEAMANTRRNAGWIVSITVDTDVVYRFTSYSDVVLGIMPGLHTVEAQAGQEIDPLNRTVNIGSYDLVFVDDTDQAGDISSRIRQLNTDYTLKGKSVEIKLGEASLAEDDYSTLVVGWAIDEVIPEPGAIRITVIDPYAWGIEKKVQPFFWSDHPIAVARTLLEQAVPDEINGHASLDETLYTDISHFAVTAHHFNDLESSNDWFSFEDNAATRVSVFDIVRELFGLVNGGVVPAEGGQFEFKKCDLDAEPVKHFSANELRGFTQDSTYQDLYTRASVYARDCEGRPYLAYTGNDYDASDEVGFTDSGGILIPREYEFSFPEKEQAHPWLAAVAVPVTGPLFDDTATAIEVHMAPYRGFCGTLTKDIDGNYLAPDGNPVAQLPEHELSVARPAYFLVTDGFGKEVVRCTTPVTFTGLNGTSVASRADGTTRSYRNVEFTALERDIFGHNGGALDWTTQQEARNLRIYDITIAVWLAQEIIRRCSNGMPRVSFDVPIAGHTSQLADPVTFDESVYLDNTISGLTEADAAWEVVGKTPIGQDGYRLSCALLRRGLTAPLPLITVDPPDIPEMTPPLVVSGDGIATETSGRALELSVVDLSIPGNPYDLLQHSPAGLTHEWENLGPGTVGTFLTSGAGLASNYWTVPSTIAIAGDVTGTLAAAVITMTGQAAGDLISRNVGNTAWNRLAIGTNNQALLVQSGLPVWTTWIGGDVGGTPGALTVSDLTIASEAAGDLLRRNAGNTAWERLAVGTNTHVLTLTAGMPGWAAPAGGCTLDQAYDFGGAGVGRTIAVDTGAVQLNVAAANVGLGIAGSLSTTGLGVTGTYTGAALDITHGVHTGSGTSRHALRVTGGAHTGLTNENIDVSIALARSMSWASGSLSFQRSVVITGPTIDGTVDVTLIATTAAISAPVRGTGTISGQNMALYLTSANTNADPTLRIDQNGTGGDASTRLTAGGTSYTYGIDNSETNDPFVISRATSLGTENLLSATGTAITLGNASHTFTWPGTSWSFSGSAGSAGMLLRSAAAGVTPAWANHGLDQAYDSGGAGVGRTITVSDGAVQLNVSASVVGFGIAGSLSTTGANITGTYTGSALDITHGVHTGSGTSRHIMRLTGGAHTGLTNENIDVSFGLSRALTWTSGTISFQRSINIAGPTLDGAGGTINLISTTMMMSAPTIGTVTHTGVNCVQYLTSANTGTHGPDPMMFFDQNGAGGDAAIRFRAGSNYAIGIAGNVASDPFKISRSTVLGTTDVISSLSTALTFGNATDNNTYVWLGTGTWSVGGGIGSSGQFLRSSGAGAAPTWATVTAATNLQTAYDGSPNANIVIDATGPIAITVPAAGTGITIGVISGTPTAGMTIASGMTNGLTNASPTTLTNALTQSGGAFSLTGNAASTLTTGAGALTITSFAALNLGTATSTSLAVGRSGITTTITGGLTQLTGAFSLTGNAASALTTSAGALTITSFAALNLGTATSTSVAIGASGITTTVTGGLTQLTGLFSLTGNAASSLTTTSGALTISSTSTLNLGTVTSPAIAIGRSGVVTTVTGGLTQLTGAFSLTGNAASDLSTTVGALTVTSAAALNLGTATSTALAIGRSGITTTITGALTQATGQVTVGGNIDANSGLDITGAALTVANQAITQTTGGQVTFAGNVDANSGLDVAGIFTVTRSVAAANQLGTFTNSDAAGDAYLTVSGPTNWSFGCDNSVPLDPFVIGNSASLGTNSYVMIEPISGAIPPALSVINTDQYRRMRMSALEVQTSTASATNIFSTTIKNGDVASITFAVTALKSSATTRYAHYLRSGLITYLGSTAVEGTGLDASGAGGTYIQSDESTAGLDAFVVVDVSGNINIQVVGIASETIQWTGWVIFSLNDE